MSDKLVAALRRWIPRSFRYGVQRQVSLTSLKLWHRERTNPFSHVRSSTGKVGVSPYRFAIAINQAQYHQSYVKACVEMGCAFDVVDLFADNWIEQLTAHRYDALLVWPDATLRVWASLIKDRVDVASNHLGILCFPTSQELWMYENKVRTADWLRVHGVSHPRTWIFAQKAPCMQFVDSCELPIVFKTSFGASASGVRIVHHRKQLKNLVKEVFASGFVANGMDWRDRQWGLVILQRYLPNVTEWRLVRIGNSFFGHPKGKVGQYHSGSGTVEWDLPTDKHLDFLEQVTDLGGFRSMAVDTFETPDATLWVNELQTVFGARVSVDQTRKDGVAGRFVRENDTGPWRFEEGDFARNACSNERIRYLQSVLDTRSSCASPDSIKPEPMNIGAL